MARPPRPYDATKTTASRRLSRGRLEYLASQHADLVQLAREVGASGTPRLEVTEDRRDLAVTLLELTGLVGHILGEYQNRYANEAYLGTAQAASSLVRHAHRLAYVPDPGLAATGHVVLWAKQGPGGVIPERLPLASQPYGEKKALDYETLRDVRVHPGLNELPVADATTWGHLTAAQDWVEIEGTGHRLPRGEPALLVGPALQIARVVVGAEELPEDDYGPARTRILLDAAIGLQVSLQPGGPAWGAQASYRLLARPGEQLRPFGFDADPVKWPAAAVQAATGALAWPNESVPGDLEMGWSVDKALPPGSPATTVSPYDQYLSGPVRPPLAGTWLLRWAANGDHELDLVTWQFEAKVALRRRETVANGMSVLVDEQRHTTLGATGSVTYTQAVSGGAAIEVAAHASQTVHLYVRMNAAPTNTVYDARSVASGGHQTLVFVPPVDGTLHIRAAFPGAGAGVDVTWKTILIRHVSQATLSGAVTGVQLRRASTFAAQGTGLIPRSELPPATRWSGAWQITQPIVARQRSEATLGSELHLQGDFSDLEPGHRLCFTTLSGDEAEVREILSTRMVGAQTLVSTRPVAGGVGKTWKLGNLRVFGNVVAVSHGRTVEAVLGDSDGVTPFLRFDLPDAPVAWLPGAAEPEPALTVRVFDVAWQRVADFDASGPHDRHYRVEIDDDQVLSVIFGDGRRGAIPPLGKGHVRATYRLGLGVEGNQIAGGVAKIKKANPLLERVWNAAPVAFGADPARPEDVRRQAPLWVRTFERAVSVQDHADLALLYPGVGQSAAAWSDARGVELTAAGLDGADLCANQGFRRWLDARRDTSIPMVLVDVEPVPIRIEVEVDFDEQVYLQETVERAVRAALLGQDEDAPGMFTFAGRRLGQAAHASEIYARLEAIESVRTVRLTRFARVTGASVVVADHIAVGHWQWLRLDDLEVVI